jgi:hypothetical protein
MKKRTSPAAAKPPALSDREWLARQFESLTTALPPSRPRKRRAR